MYKILIASILILLVQLQLVAQEKSINNRIGIEFGYNQGYFKDLLFSPLNYTQGGFITGLHYTHQSPKDKHIIEFNAQYSSGNFKVENLANFTAPYLFGKFQLGYLHKLPVFKPENLKLYLGGEYQTQIHYLNWLGPQNAASWLGTHGIRIKALVSYQIHKKHQLQTTLSLPLFQSLVRPPYNVRDEFVDENQSNLLALIFRGKPASVNKYFAIDWETTYRFIISKRFDLMVTYNMIYQRVFDIHHLIQFQNQFKIGAAFKF